MAKRAVTVKRTVLLVDDLENIRMTLRYILEFNGYRVWRSSHDGLPGAGSVRDAMAIIAKKGPPDALVTDWWMPDGRLDHVEEGHLQPAGELMLKFTNALNMVRILYSWEARAVIDRARRAAFHRRVVPCTKETSLLLFTLQDEFAHPRRWSRESTWPWPKLDRP